MKKYLNFHLLLLIVSFFFSSCSKDKEEVSAVQGIEILTANTWEVKEVMAHQVFETSLMGYESKVDTTFDVLKDLDECEYDVSYNFSDNGQLLYTLSETYCGADINGNFTWELNSADNELTITGDEGALFIVSPTGTVTKEDIVLKVLELNENTLKLRFTLSEEEFLGSYMDEASLILMEEMGAEISGSMEVDYTFLKVEK